MKEERENFLSVSLSPYEILNFISSNKNFLPVKIKGKLIYDNGYPRLVDEKGYMISLENLNFNVEENSFLEAEGLLKCYVYPNGGIYPRVEVKRINNFIDEKYDLLHFEQELLSIMKSNSFINVGFYGYFEELIYKKITNEEKIKIAVIHGKGAQTHKDFEHAFLREVKEVSSIVDLIFYEVSLSNDIELAKTIKEIENVDAIFIVRGGGKKEELEKVGGKETYKAILQTKIPVYVAIGHSLDKKFSLLEKVAQATFPTPSLAGTELGKLIYTSYERLFLHHKFIEEKNKTEKIHNELSLLKMQQEKENKEKELMLTNYQQQIQSLKKQNKILLITFSLFLLLIFVYFILK